MCRLERKGPVSGFFFYSTKLKYVNLVDSQDQAETNRISG